MRGRPKTQDVAEVEEHLLSVALSEFVRAGYGGASIAAIVKAAGISNTTLYSRFPSKEALFRAIMRREIDRLGLFETLTSTPGAPNLEQGLKYYGNRALEFSLQGHWLDINRLIYSESGRFPELGEATREAARHGIAHISDFIQRCAEADQLACRNPRAVAEAFIFMLRGWYVDQMLANRAVASHVREQWVEQMVRTLVSCRADW